MSDVNFSTVSGRLAHKPEVRTTPSGVSVADLTVANNRYSKTRAENTTFVRCTVWNKSAEYVSTLDVGDHVLIQGEISDDNYTPSGSSTQTRGRIKLDNCKVTLLRRKNKVSEQEETVSTELAEQISSLEDNQ